MYTRTRTQTQTHTTHVHTHKHTLSVYLDMTVLLIACTLLNETKQYRLIAHDVTVGVAVPATPPFWRTNVSGQNVQGMCSQIPRF